MGRAESDIREEFRGRRVLLVGLGVHGGGVATAKWLLKHGANLRVTDLKTADELASSMVKLRGRKITFHLGHHPVEDLEWAQVIVKNPDVPSDSPYIQSAKRRGLKITDEAGLFLDRFPGRIIGVTGTRGKSTTTLLSATILRCQNPDTIVTGNVRQTPMLGYLDRSRPRTWAVVEFSSFQLENLSPGMGRVHVAALTNITRDHLNRHKLLSHYVNAKMNLFRQLDHDGFAVLNAEEPWSRRAAEISRSEVIWYGRALGRRLSGITIDRNWIVERVSGRQTRLVELRRWKLPGRHNLSNLLAAVAIARAMGLPSRRIQVGVARFPGVPYRQERVRVWRRRQFINDTTATSPAGALAAIEVYPNGMFIVGGTDKQLDMRPLARALARRRQPFVTLPGTATEKLRRELPQNLRRLEQPTASMSEAVHQAIDLSKPGQAIVLSPGAASFGLFKHEFDRGDAFNRVVHTLQP